MMHSTQKTLLKGPASQRRIDRRPFRNLLWRQRGFCCPRRKAESDLREVPIEAPEPRADASGSHLIAFSRSIAEDVAFYATFRSHRLLRVKALRALVDGSHVLVPDPVKSIIWRFLDEKPMWQFQAGEDKWVDCDAPTQAALRQAEADGEIQVALRVRSWDYLYDLQKRVQTNLSTQRTRALRLRNPLCGQAVKSVDREQDPLVPRWQFATGYGWADCDEDTQRLLQQAEARGDTQVEAVLREWTYVFDIAAATQTNSNTGRARALRRGGPAAPASIGPMLELEVLDPTKH
eukprot:gnl/TRDRNA2_/TRDRNA2_182836_c0_seq1.p1 gnl/TRDRNA2_/TRDRNA2_182836_c0~~gnl/TRDRNA2_/TRDRNA2_182836_c0_seq1.p1  ORF type:complete len:291 (-),score=39.87 gnl/TRDRNA2_/TRDRNA2_182836_c0_seq1:104-976(-)